MSNQQEAIVARLRRKRRIRKRVHGTSARPRLTIYRSNKHIYAQVVDDTTAKALTARSSLTTELSEELRGKKKTDVAKIVGTALAKACLEHGIRSVVFDRNGYRYHGRVSALAAGAREAGLEF
jgi:large subunit ribosomal protein L18